MAPLGEVRLVGQECFLKVDLVWGPLRGQQQRPRKMRSREKWVSWATKACGLLNNFLLALPGSEDAERGRRGVEGRARTWSQAWLWSWPTGGGSVRKLLNRPDSTTSLWGVGRITGMKIPGHTGRTQWLSAGWASDREFILLPSDVFGKGFWEWGIPPHSPLPPPQPAGGPGERAEDTGEPTERG